MTDNPPSIPRSVIRQWIRDNRVSTLSGSKESLVTTFDETNFDSFNVSGLAQKALKSNGEIITGVFRGIATVLRNFLDHGAESYLASLFSPLTQNLKRRRALRELHSLSPEILRDIGLSQGDISVVERGRIGLHDLEEIRRHGWRY